MLVTLVDASRPTNGNKRHYCQNKKKTCCQNRQYFKSFKIKKF